MQLDLLRYARPYAKAAFEFSQEHKKIPAWRVFLKNAAELVQQKIVHQLLETPELTHQKIADCLIALLKKHCDKHQQNFLRVLAEYGKLIVLPQVFELFEQYVASADKVLHATLMTTHARVSSAFVASLKKALEKRFKKTVSIEHQQDTSLIGGAKVQIGDHVIDASLRNQLQRMAAALVR